VHFAGSEERLAMMMRLVIGVVLGGLAGFAVYYFIGCKSGTCPITANPWMSTLFGMIFGALLSSAK
jgi:hypothetical protein